jgi:hypothetical protein
MFELKPYSQMTFKDLLSFANSYDADHVMFVDDDYITYLHPKRTNGGRMYVEEIDTLAEQVENFIKQYPDGIVKPNALMEPILIDIEKAIQTVEYVKRTQRLN